MTKGYIFTSTAFIAALVVSLVMGAAWVVGRVAIGCRTVDAWMDRLLDECL